MKKYRLEITIETRSITIIRTSNPKENTAFCRSCRLDVAVCEPASAALIFQVGEQFIKYLLQTAQIHFADENALCANSLAGYFKKEIRYIED